MNIFNKTVCRTISIFLLLTLYVGLCSEASAMEEMAILDSSVISGIIGFIIVFIIGFIFSFFWSKLKIIAKSRSRIEDLENKFLKWEDKSKIEERKKKSLEKEHRSELEKLARLNTESRSMMDHLNNLEFEFKRIAEFMDMQPRENPYVAGGAVDDTRLWIGNENLINSILTSIGGNHFFIRGKRRSGKTTLLRRISRALEMMTNPEAKFIPVYVSLQGIPPQTFFKSLYSAIVSRVNINPSELDEIVDAEDLINAMWDIINSLSKSSSTKSIFVLLMDEFELFNTYPLDLRESFRTVFMNPPFSGHIRLIATGTELTVWTRSSPMNYLIELEIEPLTAKEAREMILMPARGVVGFDEAAVDRIIERTHGRPFDIQKICGQLINTAIQKRVYRIKVEDVKELRKKNIKKEGSKRKKLREASK